MNLVSLLKRKLAKEIGKKDIALRRRRQLNTMVDERLIDETKELAAEFTVPRYCLVEHLLQTGHYYLTRAMEDEGKAKMLRHHLINVHLIDNGFDDSEAILRIGEGSDISQLLFQVRPILRSWKDIQHAFALSKKTGNTTYFKNAERNLLNSVVAFAQWVEKHHLYEPDKGFIHDGQLEDNAGD
ncbi:hypothetical protein ACFLTV_01165 [Chloroflexota bacterium]